jgi:hypothetical protein
MLQLFLVAHVYHSRRPTRWSKQQQLERLIMLKSIIAASLLSATLLIGSAISASADPSRADCAYARMNIENRVGASARGTGNLHRNPDAALVLECQQVGR